MGIKTDFLHDRFEHSQLKSLAMDKSQCIEPDSREKFVLTSGIGQTVANRGLYENFLNPNFSIR